MAATRSVQIDLDARFDTEVNNDSVSMTSDQVEMGIDGFPSLSLSDGDSVTVTSGQVEWINHGSSTIGAGNTLTLDLLTLTDRATDATIDKSYVQYCVIMINDAVAGMKMQIGQFADANAVPFGQSGTSTYTERLRSFFYESGLGQDTNCLGDAIYIKNSSTITITVSHMIAGNRY